MPNEFELTAEERQRVLAAHMKVMGDGWWITTTFELRNICAEVGLQPTLEEMEEALQSAEEGKLDFAGLLDFVQSSKTAFYAPEPRDADTVRAFVAVGGMGDRSGGVECDLLRDTCARFSLNVDIDGMFKEADTDGGQSLEFSEFRAMLETRIKTASLSTTEQIPSPGLALGFDYQALLLQDLETIRKQGTKRRESIGKAGGRDRKSFNTKSTREKPTPTTLPKIEEKPTGVGTPRNTRLQKKGINPALWGGDETVQTIGIPISQGADTETSPSGRKRKGKRQKEATEKTSEESSRNTVTVGRGLLVDDPPYLPRHYPQQQQQAQVSSILPHLALASPRVRGRAALRQERAASPTALASIEKRMLDPQRNRRRLGAKYSKVQSRVNTTGNVFNGLMLTQTQPPPISATGRATAPPLPAALPPKKAAGMSSTQ